MFKYVLYRAVVNTGQIFCSIETPTALKCKQAIQEYNRRAKPVWECKERGFLERQRVCDNILDEVFSEFCDPPTHEDVQRVPGSIVKRLDAIFNQHYGSFALCLLFGRTDEDALEVQERYALSVIKTLGRTDPRHEARAHLYLRKMYGRGAPLPILTVQSASAIWRVCKSLHYQRQISLVSSDITPFRCFTDPHASFISGSSLSQRS